MTDEQYMRRCLQLAGCGIMGAKPNPMVGAVIVSADGRIIGEGYHRRCGEAHAEVNAFASVRHEDEPLLSNATIYVSLEPCSHYGKTPPCADLIIKKGVKRCVVGCVDPFAKVQGRKRSIRSLAENFAAHAELSGRWPVGIAHAGCRREALELAAMLKEHDPKARIIVVDYEPVTGSHVGPGALAMFYVADQGD